MSFNDTEWCRWNDPSFDGMGWYRSNGLLVRVLVQVSASGTDKKGKVVQFFFSWLFLPLQIANIDFASLI